MEKEITRLSVHEFVGQALSSGDLFAAAADFGQMREGVRAHQQIQRQEGAGFTAEVPVLFRREGEHAVLEIGGRMDGWRIDGSGPTVLEIKSTWQDPAGFPEGVEAHWNQARVYGAIRCAQEGFARIGIELLYVRLPEGETRRIRREFDGPELAAWLLDLCDGWLREAGAEWEYRTARGAALGALAFPFDAFREGQREMAARVYRAAREGSACLVQAPTGIGKTMAALFPALKALGEGYAGRIFYLTARTTVKNIAEETAARLRAGGAPFRSVTLTAKEKCCPEPGIPCHPAWCPRAAGYFDRLGGALREAFSSPRHFGRDDVGELAGRHGLCPFELSLDLSLRCDLIICDYNYAFDPRVYLRRFFEEPGDALLLVDEAHNLVDRARDMFSVGLEKEKVQALARHLRGKQASPETGALKKAAGALSRALLAAAREPDGETEEAVFPEPPPELTRAARNMTGAIEPLLGGMGREPYAEAMLDLYFECFFYVRGAEEFDDCCAVYRKGGKRRTLVRVYCVDPSTRLAARFGNARSAVLYSASLTPFAYFKRLMGLREASELSLPSPFPADNLRVLVDPAASTAYRHRDDTLPQVAESLRRLALGRPGRYMAYFPSYRYMSQAHALFCALCPELETLAQRPGMGEGEREEFLSRFDAGGPPLMGFAVMGGAFAEGVDLAGDRLIGAAVVGVGLPQLCVERDIIRRYHDGQGEDGFAFAYSLPGFIRVMQAAGRVIRGPEERGVVLLIDPRFTRWDMRELMPGWWEPVGIVESPEALTRELEEFWADS